MKTLRFLLLISAIDFIAGRPSLNTTGSRLIQNDWASLEEGTQFRYFNPAKYSPGGSEDDIWDLMGEDIHCTVHDDLSVDLVFPADADLDKPFKFMTHGFSSHVTGGKTRFVDAWMQTNNMEANVVLVNWPDMAFIGQITDWDSLAYDSGARNAVDIGEYIGYCLAAFTNQEGVPGSNVHLVGHSLGAHMMGKAGRTYHELTGEKVARVTGLDPAGPRFVDGPIESALPELHENRLSPESAEFVDVIHTDGALEPAVVWFTPRAGDLHPLGHLDFYPQGGDEQPGCEFLGPDYLPGGICDHRRSMFYFLHSIWDPTLFPTRECSDVDTCSEGEVVSDDVVAYMGQNSQEFYNGERKLFYLEIQDRHWDYTSHN